MDAMISPKVKANPLAVSKNWEQFVTWLVAQYSIQPNTTWVIKRINVLTIVRATL